MTRVGGPWLDGDFELVDVGASTAVEFIEVPSSDALGDVELVGVSDLPPGVRDATGHASWRQEDPQSVVTITHNLGFRPAGVALFSLDYGIKYRAYGVQHLDENTLRVSMDQPTPFVCEMS